MTGIPPNDQHITVWLFSSGPRKELVFFFFFLACLHFNSFTARLFSITKKCGKVMDMTRDILVESSLNTHVEQYQYS